MNTKIEPDKLYSLSELMRLGVFKNRSLNGVKAEIKRSGLQFFVVGEGGAKRYYIKGKDLLDYLKK